MSIVYMNGKYSESAESISTLGSESEFDDQGPEQQNRSAAGSFVSLASNDSEGDDQHASHFEHDAASSLYDSLVSNHESTSVQLELTSLRMATNASEHQVRKVVAIAFTKRISQLVNEGKPMKMVISTLLEGHKDLINRTMFDKNKSDKADQVDFLLLVQTDLLHREKGEELLLSMATELCRLDVIEPEAVEQWWEDPRSYENGEMARVRGKTQALVDFYKSDSDDDDEDEEEDDEDDDDGDDDGED
jgi:translation initiation factor eIF-2B subunit epsilon